MQAQRPGRGAQRDLPLRVVVDSACPVPGRSLTADATFAWPCVPGLGHAQGERGKIPSDPACSCRLDCYSNRVGISVMSLTPRNPAFPTAKVPTNFALPRLLPPTSKIATAVERTGRR